MEENKTRLQLEVEKIQDRLSRVIVEEIENGKKATPCIAGVYLEDVLLMSEKPKSSAAIVIHVEAPEIEELFMPSLEDLKAQKEGLEKKLQEVTNQLKEKGGEQ